MTALALKAMVVVTLMASPHNPSLLQKEIRKGQTFLGAHTATGAQTLVIMVALTAMWPDTPPMGTVLTSQISFWSLSEALSLLLPSGLGRVGRT